MAYTKYSLTPSNNTATPPDGAPEGMLPSAVNDTMRDMMAQIRDCGDGIRDGTYTMTAPKITGGTITGVAFTGNTFTSPVISGGSINNTPIGATTANTGAFTTLSATGVTTVQAGTNSAPAITTSGDTNTGIFFPAADTIAFTEGGVESMRITNSGGLCVGLTTDPGGGNINIKNDGFYGWGGLDSLIGGTSAASGYIYFRTGGAEKMRIDSSGNVGIGTSSPAQKFVVSNAGAEGFELIPTGVDSGPYFQAYNRSTSAFVPLTTLSSHIAFRTGTSPTERMRIDSSGNVGIGTSSPSTYGKFAVVGSSGSVETYVVNTGTTVQAAMWTQNNSGTKTGILHYGSAQGPYGAIGIGEGALYSSNNLTIMCDVAGGVIKFATGGNTERMRITSDGYLLVNTTSTVGGSSRIGVLFAGNATNGINTQDSTTTSGAVFHQFSNSAGTIIGSISRNGTTNAVLFNTTSDQRLKSNITDAAPVLDKLMNVKVRQFDWTEGNLHQDAGFIAQELAPVLSGIVTEGKKEEDLWNLDYSRLTPYLVKAIQEQQALIVDLQERLTKAGL